MRSNDERGGASGAGAGRPRAARRPIEPAPTGVAVFIGVAEGAPDLIDSWPEFTARWRHPSALATAVETFFLAGGGRAWVAPLPDMTAEAARTAVSDLHPDVSLVAVVADPAAPPAVIAAVAEALASRRAVLLVEGPWTDAATAQTAMAAGPLEAVGVEGSDAALFWPRLRRSSLDGEEAISPLGAVAGAIAKNDRSAGVSAAAAGPRGELPGILTPATPTTQAQREALNARSVNVVAAFPGRGTLLWGARTLSPDPEWRYLPVRRTALFVEESLSRGLQWAAFERNDEPLWSAVRDDVAQFLHELWRASAFVGRTQREAFFVRCDRTTMTDADIADGTLVCLVGFAPIRPAEFVVLRVAARATPT